MKPRHALSDGPSFGAMGLPRRLQRLVLSLPTGLLLAVPIFAPADLLAQRWLDIGIVAGTAESVWIGDHGTGREWRRAAVGGMTARTDLTEAVGLQMDLLHVGKGVQVDGVGSARFDYIEAPLLVRVGIPRSRLPVRPVAVLGVVPSREVASHCTGRTDLRQELPMPVSCRFVRQRQYDIGLVYGGGLEMRTGRFSVSLESRRSHGTQDIAAGSERTRITYRTTMHLISGAIRLCSC